MPATRQDQVRGLDVAVHDRRLLRVQEHQRLGGLSEVRHHARGRQARCAPLSHDPCKVGPVDPVHCHDVLVLDEEVLTDERQRRMRLETQQHARLAKQLLARLLAAHPPDLQRDHALVTLVERFDHVRLAAGAEALEDLIPSDQQTSVSKLIAHRVAAPRRRLDAIVAPQIEVISGVRSWRIALDSGRVTIGKAPENDVPLEGDPTASRLHAVLEQFSAGWCVSDLGSSNGTSVNGERIWASHRLQHGDEIRIGQTRLVFHDPLAAHATATQADEAPPSLTSRERDVLLALCRPLLDRDMFTEPARRRRSPTTWSSRRPPSNSTSRTCTTSSPSAPKARAGPGSPTRRCGAAPSPSRSCATRPSRPRADLLPSVRRAP